MLKQGVEEGKAGVLGLYTYGGIFIHITCIRLHASFGYTYRRFSSSSLCSLLCFDMCMTK